MSDEIEKSPEAFRTITEVARWLDTPAHVLRFWESRFPEIAPVKRAGGRRYYRPEDMKILGGIKAMLHDQGQSIRDVQERLAEDGLEGVKDLSPAFDFSRPPSEDDDEAPASRLTFSDTTPPEPSTSDAPEADTGVEEPVAELPADSPEEDVPEVETAPAADAPDETQTPYELSESEAVDNVDDAALTPEETASEALPPEPVDAPLAEQTALFPEALPEATPPADTPAPSAFRSRRSRSQDAKESDAPAAPIRGFFFNDIDEPALGASDDLAPHLLDDDDDPEAYAGFSALGERAQSEAHTSQDADEPEQVPEEEDLSEETLDAEPPEDAIEPAEATAPPPPPPAEPIDLEDLPRDPGPSDLPWPAAPVLTAELRALTGLELRDRLGSSLPDLADRLQSLQGRISTRSGNP